MKKLTTNEFVSRSNKIHHFRFDYSKSIYINGSVKVIIICKKHGNFLQSPEHHLNGIGCPICGGTFRLTLNKFIERAVRIHKNKYDYSEFVYVNYKTKSFIICPLHGKFLQSPNDHLTGYGCMKCGKDILANKYRKKLSEFINSATKIHLNKYDYSGVIYRKNNKKVSILCPIHGQFLQTPSCHLAEQGCPTCKTSKGETKIRKFLEENTIPYETQKTFDDCKNKRKLKFDFYLPTKNILIEYDGEQHFRVGRVGSHYTSKSDVKDIQRRDIIKTKYARSKGILLIRIKYTELLNIPEKLKSTLDLL